MNYEEKINEFADIVLKDAATQKQTILDEIRDKQMKVRKETQDELKKGLEQRLKEETSKALRDKNQEWSRLKMEAKKELIQTRNSMLSKMYDNLVNKLKEFSKSEQYRQWLLEHIKTAVEQINDKDIEVKVGSDDEKLAEWIFQSTGYRAEIDKEITLGGCKVIGIKKRLLVDYTLQKRLEDEFSKFDELN